MIVDILSWVCILLGCFLGIVGGVGLLRFPDLYSRLHAVGLTDSLCAALILFGLGLQAGWSFESIKLFLIFAFLFFTSPTSSYSLAHSAWRSGIKPWARSRAVSQEDGDD